MTKVSGVDKGMQNINFRSRHIEIHHCEDIPERVLNSIKNHKALDEFIRAGQPKSFWEKIIDYFKAEEHVDIYYDKRKTQPYLSPEELTIDFGKRSEKKGWRSMRGLRIIATDAKNSSPSPVTPEERILKEFESITDFDKSLTPNFDIVEV